MKNLYRRLGLGSSATTKEIRRAIRACRNAETAQDAEAVLLSPGRRKAYDRAFRTLFRIAAVRDALDLQDAANWSQQNRAEFPSVKIASPPQPSDADSSSFRGVGCLVAIIIAAVALFGSAQLDSCSRTQSSSETGPPAVTESRRAPKVDRAKIFAFDRLSPRGATDAEIRAAGDRLRRGLTAPRPGTRVLTQSRRGTVPVTIKTSAGDDYYVKFLRFGSTFATGYIHGGRSLTFDLPAGGYEVRYASGKDWYGYELDFGPDASYAKCDGLMQFEDGYTHTIELIKQINGNLRTSPMSADDF